MSNSGFRQYRPADQDSCLALFDANCPASFAPNERTDYLAFLQDDPAGYEVCLLDGRLAGAFGLCPCAPGEGSLNWILLFPQMQGRGPGSAIVAYVLEKARSSGVLFLRIAASHKSAPFFARFGAEAVAETPNGWGPGMHRIDMELRL